MANNGSPSRASGSAPTLSPSAIDESSYVAGASVSTAGTNGGGNFESLDTSDTATVTVDDTANTTTLTLDDVTVDEADNGMATIHGRLDYSPQTQLVVTLSNGATITFESSYVAGATVSSTAFPINNDEDVYLDSSSFVVSVSGTNGGGNFESLDTSDTATVTVDDTPNTTTLTLDDVTVDEADNGMATIHGRLDYSPQTQLVVTLSNGATITFESSYVAGAAVSSTAFPINNDEDVYLDSSSFVVSVSGTNGGGNFESLDTSDTATVTVDDTANTTTLTLDDVTVDEADNGMATIHGRLDYSPQTQLVVTLSNGATITFESSYVAGATVSSTAFPINNDEDVYLDSSSFVVSVSGTNGGGNFESLDTSDTATVTVDDTPNTTTLTLDDVTVDEADNGMATIHGRLDYSPQTQLVVTLSNGATITFESSYVAGAAVSSTAFPINNDEDVYLDSSSFVVSVSGTNGGGNFESLDTSDTATVTVDDTANTTTLTLDDVTVDEADNGMATIHGRLDYSPQTQLVVTLSNGATITFESSYVAGAAVSSTAFPINNDEDVYLDSSSFVVSVSGTNGGGNFESLDTSDTATVTVDDTANTTTLTLDDVTVDEADNGMATIHGRLDYSPQTQLVVTLSNGATITFESSYVAGAAVSSTAFPINNDEDVYLDSSSFVVSVSGTNGGGNFESLDTSDTATVTVDDTANTTTLTLDDVTVDEADNGMATIHGRLDYSPQTQLVVTLSNGATITFESSYVAGAAVSSTAFPINNDEDVYLDSSSFVVSVSGTNGGGNFESLDTSDTATVTVDDTPNTTTLTLDDVTVDEADNGMATIHGRLDYSPQTQLVVTLSNGATITFESSYVAGAAVSSTAFPINNDEDVYLDSSSFVVSVSGTNGGGNFESLDTSDTATVTVDDTANTTTLTLDDVTVDEADNGMATIHGRLDYSPQTQLVVTLSNGATITFESSYVAGAAVSSTAFPINNDEDVYLDSSSFVVSVSGTNGGGNFESLDTSDTATVTVDDTPNTTTLTLDDVTVDEADNGMATIHGRLDYSPQTQLVVTLSNGATITFESSYVAGATVSSTAFPINNDEDVYLDSSSFVVSVSGTNGGGNFESLDTSDTATVNVNDTADITSVVLSATPNPVVEGHVVTFTATLTNVDNLPVDNHSGMTVTLSNGQSIDIMAGDLSGEVTYTIVDDELVEVGETVSVRLTGVTPDEPDEFERLKVNPAEVVVRITDDDHAPENILGTSRVSEEGLVEGIEDNTGTPDDQSDLADQSGTFTFSDLDSSLADLSVSWDSNTINLGVSISSGGQNVIWSLDPQNANKLIGSAGGEEVMWATLGNIANGSAAGDYEAGYIVQLLRPLDHPQNSVEDVLNFDLAVSVSDGSNTTQGQISVSVEDDMPVAGDLVQEITVPPVNTNLVVMLDMSRSMAWKINANTDPGAGELSRLDVAKSTISNLISSYNSYGAAKVQIVLFDGDALTAVNSSGSKWFDTGEAINYINNLGHDDIIEFYKDTAGTNYDAALAQLINTFDSGGKYDGSHSNTNNVSYFFSDGEPTVGDGNSSELINTYVNSNAEQGIQPAEKVIWESFLEDNRIDSHAVGLGPAFINSALNQLHPIAFNGSAGAGAGVQKPALGVADPSDLNEVIQGTISLNTVDSALVSVTNSLNQVTGLGADGGYVSTVVFENETYLFDGSNIVTQSSNDILPGTLLVIDTQHGGKLSINMLDGEYEYTAKAGLNMAVTEALVFTLVDGDGDGASGTLTLNVVPDFHPPVASNLLLSNVDSGFIENINFDNHITDSDDPALAGVKLIVESLPESGWLYGVNSQGDKLLITENMLQGGSDEQVFLKSSLSYQADPLLPRISVAGDTAVNQETDFELWGIDGAGKNHGQIDINTGQYIALDVLGGGTFGIVNPNSSHRGGGLGVISGSPGERGYSADVNARDEKIQATFVGIVVKAVAFTLDGLGGFFRWKDGSGNDIEGTERVELVISDSAGNAILPSQLNIVVDGDDNLDIDNGRIFITNNDTSPADLSRVVQVSTNDPGVTIGGIVFALEGDPDKSVGSFELRNIQLNTGIDDAFQYVAIDADGLTSNTATVTVDSSGFLFTPKIGTQNNNTLTAKAGENSRLSGLDGDDTLTGQSLVDVLIGGRGNDTLTGGAGKDFFVWNQSDVQPGISQQDTVTDFTLAGNPSGDAPDVVDLRDLLDGLLVTSTAEDLAAELSAFINLQMNGTETVISFDDSVASGAPSDLTIVFENLDDSAWGNSVYDNQSSQTILETMINNGQLLV